MPLLTYLNVADPEETNIEDAVGNEAGQIQSNVVKTESHNTGKRGGDGMFKLKKKWAKACRKLVSQDMCIFIKQVLKETQNQERLKF